MKSWNEPSPYGLVALDRRAARAPSRTPRRDATRPARAGRAPRGKSQSGRSPRSGLYTARSRHARERQPRRGTSRWMPTACGPSGHLAAGEDVQRLSWTTWSLLRGQACPPGSWGWLHHGADLAAPFIKTSACLTNAAAWARVIRTRADAGSPPSSSSRSSSATTRIAIARLVVADRDRGDDPGDVDGLEQREVARGPLADGRQLLEKARKILGERAHLLFSLFRVTSVPFSRDCR